MSSGLDAIEGAGDRDRIAIGSCCQHCFFLPTRQCLRHTRGSPDRTNTIRLYSRKELNFLTQYSYAFLLYSRFPSPSIACAAIIASFTQGLLTVTPPVFASKLKVSELSAT